MSRAPAPHTMQAVQIDRLSPLLERFRVRAELFHNGPLCGVTRFAARPGTGFLHVMRRGEMTVSHRLPGSTRRSTRQVTEPSLLFYPRPLAHDFHNAPAEGCDFTCATLQFERGEQHPLARALPPVVVLPLAEVGGLEHALAALFAETEQLRCGQRLVADRLFEVVLLQLLRWLLDHPGHLEVNTGLLCGLAHPRLAAALVALHERPGEPWTLEAMAREAGMSRSAFAACFREQVGETPADYLAGWRLFIAQGLLEQGKPVKAIASELGYANASSLARAFARKTGVTPTGRQAAGRDTPG